jgi:hypothetical protein
MRRSLFLLLCGIAWLPVCAETTLNLSHDLVPLGVDGKLAVPP